MTVRRLVILALLGIRLFFHDVTVFARPEGSAGLIIAVNGDVTVAREGKNTPAIEGLVLQLGDTISVKSGGWCSGFRADGNPFRVTGPNALVVELSSQQGVLDKVRGFIARQIAQWSGASRSEPLVSRGVRDWKLVIVSPSTLLPASDGAVRASHPRFFWTTVPGSDSYLVTIAPEEGDEITQTIRGHSMAPESLEAGKNYMWAVEVEKEGSHADPNWSAFRVMASEDEKQLDEALIGLSDLEAGVLLFSAGLHEEAIYCLDAAVNTGTERRSALHWRARVLAAIGLEKDAYEDLVQTIER